MLIPVSISACPILMKRVPESVKLWFDVPDTTICVRVGFFWTSPSILGYIGHTPSHLNVDVPILFFVCIQINERNYMKLGLK